MTLETAKQLKELGWDKETEKYCIGVIPIIVPNPAFNVTKENLDNFKLGMTEDLRRLADNETYPCPSLEELLAVMPVGWNDKITGAWYSFTMQKYFDKDENIRYSLFYGNINSEVIFHLTETDPTEAVAMLWAQLRKEGIV